MYCRCGKLLANFYYNLALHWWNNLNQSDDLQSPEINRGILRELSAYNTSKKLHQFSINKFSRKIRKMKTTIKTMKKVLKADGTYEGDGFLVHRSVGSRSLKNLDPFLMLDEFGPIVYKKGEAKGASWHPHRGFETVTYMLEGEFQHKDSLGYTENLRKGDVQWMTAGSGIIHDESPSEDLKNLGGKMHGFQLWVNLPKKLKMCTPNYNGLKDGEIPRVDFEGGYAKIIAGEAMGTSAKINTQSPIQYLDVHLEKKGSVFTHPIPKSHNAFVYVYNGNVTGGDRTVEKKHIIVYNQEDGEIQLKAESDDTKFLLLSGEPIGEPIVQYGPFVMNTYEEIEQAMTDYQSGKFAKKATVSHAVEHSDTYSGEK
jgi:redox-sensitive bicupin YhaK (pirin superfamily)